MPFAFVSNGRLDRTAPPDHCPPASSDTASQARVINFTPSIATPL
ncbi:unnamed protein product (plasmid) [Mycetohabitans rhizoxinica HKI 454]|uniref:Uncharacterized protein n=1 Tax=Mycetohabitans rhizoxinica (strain DSM 19002 / CIP 109453 / HKI 454) TaxID=882378 RepID=E5AW69_MYCRK|nr:unnamed protein product [Mycetohabitans rhizoxinica HKI 454]